MRFKYKGITRKGAEPVVGIVDARNEEDAHMILKSKHIRALSLVKERKPVTLELNFKKPINLKGITIFTRQFSSLIDSGVPVAQCLDVLIDQEKRKPFKKILEDIRDDIQSGASLAEAFAKHPRVFSDFFVRVVEAGEMSGTLDTALRRVGTQLEKLAKLKAKVIGALTYPSFTVLGAVVLVVFMLIKVIPGIATMYADGKAELPAITQFVLDLSTWLQENFLVLIVMGVASVISIALAYRSELVREKWDPIALKIPLFGQLILKSSVAKFTRTMGTLVSSGVPLLTAFDICIRLMDNYAIKNSLSYAANAVQEGKSLAQGLSAGKIFPSMVLNMINVGEMTGRLDDLLTKVADIYDDEVDDVVSNLTNVLQPILIVFVGAAIAVILVAMYLPIFTLADKLTGGGG